VTNAGVSREDTPPLSSTIISCQCSELRLQPPKNQSAVSPTKGMERKKPARQHRHKKMK